MEFYYEQNGHSVSLINDSVVVANIFSPSSSSPAINFPKENFLRYLLHLAILFPKLYIR